MRTLCDAYYEEDECHKRAALLEISSSADSSAIFKGILFGRVTTKLSLRI